jgi:hypothetical protein
VPLSSVIPALAAMQASNAEASPLSALSSIPSAVILGTAVAVVLLSLALMFVNR